MPTYSERLCKLCHIQPIEIKGHEIYPDFTEPENFCKLYELKVRYKGEYRTLANITSIFIYWEEANTRNSFLVALIEYLSAITPKSDYWNFRVAITTKIKNTKWT